MEANVWSFLRDRARLIGWLFVACVIPSVLLLTADASPGVVLALVFVGSAVAAWRANPAVLVTSAKRESVVGQQLFESEAAGRRERLKAEMAARRTLVFEDIPDYALLMRSRREEPSQEMQDLFKEVATRLAEVRRRADEESAISEMKRASASSGGEHEGSFFIKHLHSVRLFFRRHSKFLEANGLSEEALSFEVFSIFFRFKNKYKDTSLVLLRIARIVLAEEMRRIGTEPSDSLDEAEEESESMETERARRAVGRLGES